MNIQHGKIKFSLKSSILCIFFFLFLCRKTKSRKLHNHKNIINNKLTDQSESQSLIVHDSQQKNDLTHFYLTTSDKLLEAKRIFSQGLSSYTQNHSSWEHSLKLLNDSYRLYEQIIREINLDTVNLYEYGK
jgi:hypothetical protein